MKLRELINRLEELSDNGKNDNLGIIVSQPDIPIAGPIENIYIDGTQRKYITIEIQ